jgi:hypothetical protein
MGQLLDESTSCEAVEAYVYVQLPRGDDVCSEDLRSTKMVLVALVTFLIGREASILDSVWFYVGRVRLFLPSVSIVSSHPLFVFLYRML